MKQVNFSHPGGFPLEQETLERLQTAYRSELFEALKKHLSIEPGENYIVAPATTEKQGWAIILQEEKDIKDPEGAIKLEGILYPIKKGANTGYLKTTRKGTSLIYGRGVSQTAYFDYEAEYITQTAFNLGVTKISDALTEYYYESSKFKDVLTLQKIEDNIDAIGAAINLINQTYLPLNGSKPMKGDLDLDIYKLSKLDIKESAVANVRAIDFRLGSASKRGFLHPADPLGRALVDDSNQSTTSLSLNYQSDWQNTNIGGKVYLENLNTSNSTGSLLVIDNANHVTKSNSLPQLLDRITALESKIANGTAVPIGMIALWGKPAPFPEGWEEYVPLKGKMPVGFNIDETEFNSITKSGGIKSKSLSIEEMPPHSHTYEKAIPIRGYDFQDRTPPFGGYESADTSTVGEGKAFSILNPYKVVYFIEYTGISGNRTAPTDLRASNIGNTTATLSWTAPADNADVTNYLIYKNDALLIELGNILTYNAIGLSSSAPDSFYVKAKNTAGNVSAATNTLYVTTVPDTIAPTAPTGLIAYSSGDSHITLEWNASTDNVAVDRYRVYRRTSSGSYEIYLGTTYTNCTVLGSANTTYFFKVTALDAAGNESGFSNEVTGAVEPVNSCFDVESLVTMASGQSKKLKNIVVGDKLQGLTFPNEIDESEGDYMQWNGKLIEATKAEVTVVNKRTSVEPNYYEIKTTDTTIKATGEHPLLVTEDGENLQWVSVKNIVQSMLLIDKTGKTKAIESILFKEEPLEVALLDVENVDNYVISGIVAHNSKPIDPKDPNAPEL